MEVLKTISIPMPSFLDATLVINDPRELAAHLFEGVRPEMAKEVHSGDYVVGR